jgi:xylan 1,4-beta-xylosidase
MQLKLTVAFLTVMFIFSSCHLREVRHPGDQVTQVSELSHISDSIQNPILRGFNPDPCILRVGADYYIVTSSFEWFPGIPLYHSRDLVHWHQVGHILNSEKMLNLRGVGNSSGIFAPSIHFINGRYYVLYTIVSGQFPFLATPNYIISSDSVTGPWSDPVYLNSTGFDPSLFTDDDGHSYLLNMQLDFYHATPTGGISIQEIDLSELKLKGQARNIFKGTCFGTEGPRIYKHNNRYYLFTAEGGTDWAHQVTVARSENLFGPYQPDPMTPLISSKNDPGLPIQRAGHASLVETQNGLWYITYLGSRPVMPQRKSILGRESFIQPVEWTNDGWIRLCGGGNVPLTVVPSPRLPDFIYPSPPSCDSFDGPVLNIKYQSLRQGFHSDWISLEKKKGFLAIRGRKPFNNLDDQSMLMQRITSLKGYAETCIEFDPENYRQMAGLMCFYDTRDFIFLKVSRDDKTGKYLGITHQQGAEINTESDGKIILEDRKPVYLRVDFSYDSLYFSYSADKEKWSRIGPVFDFTQLSDEHNKYGFTGAMVGVAAYDMMYENTWAYFDYLTYETK